MPDSIQHIVTPVWYQGSWYSNSSNNTAKSSSQYNSVPTYYTSTTSSNK